MSDATPPQADDLVRRVAEALRLGVERHRAGRLGEAERHYRQVLSIAPRQPDALHLLGLIANAAGRPEAAIELIDRAIAAKPDFPEAHTNLGNIQRRLGRLAEAEATYRRAIALARRSVEAYVGLALVLKERGMLGEAEASLREAVALRPESPATHLNLATVLAALGRDEEAEAALREALRLQPGSPLAHFNLANLLRAKGRVADAEATYRQAIALKADYYEALSNLALLLRDEGRTGESEPLCRQALALRPDMAELHNNLGGILNDLGQSAEAESILRHALAIRPGYVDATANLGAALINQGKLAEATELYRETLAAAPHHAGIRSNLLLVSNYDPSLPPAELARRHRELGQAWDDVAARTRVHANDRNPERRLRIGYVSADFRAHVCAIFTEPLLIGHDRGAFDVYCYANVDRPDGTTRHFRTLANHWRSIVGMSVEDVTAAIRSDSIDILIDLGGHTAGNCLPVFARKPAPVQVSWLGYPNTTGLAAIDYRITDPWADPVGETEAFYAETLIRLPRCFLAYTHPDSSLQVAPPPALGGGPVTFGSFNYPIKLNPRVAGLWARILAAVPGSTLLLKYPQLGQPSTQAHYRDMFAAAGLDPARITFSGRVPGRVQHLSYYDRIDIALDPFPYNGTTTTCEAMWMGVPVITLAGGAHAGRVGASLLHSIGLDELVAASEDEYVAKAVALATDLDRLAMLRASLRMRVERSPLCDLRGFVRAMEAVYRDIWRRWCEGAAAPRSGP